MRQATPPKSTIVTTTPLEWITIKEASRLFSIGRSSLYSLMGERKIKSTCLRIRGNQRGKRLISAESLRLFLESGSEG
ncbi:MAG: helix-turn-helix domain-containing protein [Prosthecobacter sp.]|jgi:hypothetical protein|uniref:helix-turn-helix domain-containing protein n=1 Tax=Prosthecobacter sp. TaxID=1965333 RepID=UPI0019F94250|nr:helix-turn-helix domain-containing protein [Prosthecobacter sp.]MBE2287900.1 helix-turn-helix domain-containing protein [Prosthecobacter sp.]